MQPAQTTAQRMTRFVMGLGAPASFLMGFIFLAGGITGGTLAAYNFSTLGLLYLALTLAFIELARAPIRNKALWRLLLIMQLLDFAHQSYHLIRHNWPRWFIGGWWLGDLGTLIVIGTFGWAWYRTSDAK